MVAAPELPSLSDWGWKREDGKLTGPHKKLPRHAMNSSSVGVQHASRDSCRGEGDGKLPPPLFRKSPPPLNQHKYYSKMILKHKQQLLQQKDMQLFKNTLNFCQRRILAVKALAMGTVSGRWGASDDSHPPPPPPPPPFRKNRT